MRQWTVDAFANQPFKGNGACVVEPFETWPEAGWMQALAAENNQAETAFLLKTPYPACYGLRWFTPTTEVRLCGHATLASAHVLWETGVIAEKEVAKFDTLSGPLEARCSAQGIIIDLPAIRMIGAELPEDAVDALGIAG